jgi:hypothetical protein
MRHYVIISQAHFLYRRSVRYNIQKNFSSLLIYNRAARIDKSYSEYGMG